MYRVRLTEEQRDELHRRTRAPELRPRTRDRLEMVRLSDAGWKVPQIARHLRVSVRRVRFWLRQFLDEGFDALPDQPHRGRPGRLTREIMEQLRQELDRRDRTWTRAHVADWLEEQHGVCLSISHLGVMLRRHRLSCRRTEGGLEHKQDPEKVAAFRADLETLEKGAMPGAWT